MPVTRYLLAIALALGVGAVPALAEPTREQVEAERRSLVFAMVTIALPHEVSTVRETCFRGEMPAFVVAARAKGDYFVPDAADYCVAAIARHNLDNVPEAPYYLWLKEIGGTSEKAASVLRAVASAALHGQPSIAIGNNKTAKMRPAMAFDAGFVVAYQDRAAVPAGKVSAAALRTVTEACLADKQDIATCYSVGVLHGAQTYREMTARR